jgi:flavin-dependent dehydrogenase
MQELPCDAGPVVEDVVDRFEFSVRERGSFVRGGRKPLVYMTQRRRLDHFLVEQAMAVGADFRDEVRISDLSERGARVDGKFVSSELLIGADGVNGVSRRLLGLGGSYVYAVALEGNLAHGLVEPERWRGRAVVDLGTILGGYGWILPKRDHVNVGIGGWESEGPRLRGLLKVMCQRRGFDYSKLEDLRGYRLAARRPGSLLASRRMLLVGDAAGLVDPLWGDGIYSAILSAKFAAAITLDFLAGRTASLEPYARSVVHELGSMIGFGWDAKLALDRFPRLSLSAVLSPFGWGLVEGMLRAEISELGTGGGLPGVALRAFQASAGRAGWPGQHYRLEVGTDSTTAIDEIPRSAYETATGDDSYLMASKT